MLSKEQILKARTSLIKKTKIKSLGGDVIIRMISMRETEQFTQLSEGLSSEDTAILYVSFLLANEDGSRMFTTKEDIEALSDLPPAAISEIAEYGNTMNGVDSNEVEETAKK